VLFGPEGAKGLLTGKKTVVLTSRGGVYSKGSPRASFDYQEPYLRQILAYVGLTDITFVHAENQQRRDQAQQARDAALGRIAELLSTEFVSTVGS